MASSFWFFTGFIVRGSSEGTNDTLDLIALALGLAAVVACRQCLGLVWWESLLPLILSAGVPGYIRTRWPRRDLPPALRSREARRRVVEVTPPLLDYKKEKRDRRERKRERQLSALRRSQRRG